MTDFLVYNLKAGFILALFYLLYVLLLRKETFYGLNRAYLLFGLVISFLLPTMDISINSSVDPSPNKFIYVEHTLREIGQTLNYVEKEAVTNVNSFPIIPFLLVLGMGFGAFRVGLQLFSIYKYIKKYEIETNGKYHYVLVDKQHTTHSFFNFIFIRKSDYKHKQLIEVVLHEQIHAIQWHSLDLLLVGFLSVLQWFNPFIYLFQRVLTETHEFQADQAVMKRGVDKLRYQKLLLGQARSIVFAGLTSKFNQSLIKNRLERMNSIKSSKAVIVKYALVMPVVLAFSVLISCSPENIDTTIQKVLYSENGKMSFEYGEGAITFEARDSIESDGELFALYGGAKVEIGDIALMSDRIIINKQERIVYNFTEDDIPSISPIEEKYLKRLSSSFGMRIHPITKEKKMHNGIDFSAETGTPVLATANGEIRAGEFEKSYGNRVIIDHANGISTSYSQLETFNVTEGQAVNKGEVIGYVGSTGLSAAPHLHYEVMKDGTYVDPAAYLAKPLK